MARRHGLTEENAIALIEAACSDCAEVVAFSAVQVVAGLGTTPGAWYQLGPQLRGLLDVPPGTPNRRHRLRLLAAVPLASAQRRLAMIAADPADPDRDFAAGLLASTGTRLDGEPTRRPAAAAVSPRQITDLMSGYVGGDRPVDDVARALGRADVDVVMHAFGEQLTVPDEGKHERLTRLLQHTLMQPVYAKPWDLHRPAEIVNDLATAAPATEAEPPPREVFPRLECPKAVVVEVPFECVVGLAPREDLALVSTGAIAVPGERVELEVLVTVDPESLRIAEGHRHTLTVDAGNPFPAFTLHVTALGRRGLAPDRRIGVHYLRDGKVIGIAWRRLTAVPSESDLPTATTPGTGEQELLDLSPLLAEEAPDLVLAVYHADDAGHNRFVWAAYPTAAGIAVPDVKRAKDIGENARQFATDTRRRIANPQAPAVLFRELAGYGVDIAQAIPTGIQDVLRTVAAQPGRAGAAAVLLLTEEPYVPWEMAVLDPPLQTSFGGTSPFLGAHVAIARWPLEEDSPHPAPQTTVEVRRQAVLTARYGEGIPRWKRLEKAEMEAASLARDYPPVAVVSPVWSDVVKCLGGEPPVDLIHVALHGQFDEQGLEDGLVLLRVDDAKGTTAAEFLTARQIRALKLPTRPFVFLNACQVGAGNEILGSYAGMAVSILRAGARAVIAPLWNIDDDVAAAISGEFYAEAYGTDPPPVAEILRRIRARYTETDAGSALVTPTRIAYQLFGHPRLKLRRIVGG